MLKQIFATKIAMTQAWTKEGLRLPVTRCLVEPNQVLTSREIQVKAIDDQGQPTKVTCQMLEIGYGAKKAGQMSKPLHTKVTKAGFDAKTGVKQIRGLRDMGNETNLTPGSTMNLADLFQVGDVVEVQGTSKGKGFAGGMKRHGFHGGPATHGQSDRARAIGSIGQRTQPGRVYKGHRMAGHMGAETVTVTGLTIVHIDTTTNEIWLSGPIPGANRDIVRLNKTGTTKKIALDNQASGLVEEVAKVEVEEAAATPVETEVTQATETTEVETTPAAEVEKQEA